MTREELTERVRTVVASHLGVDPAEVTDQARFMDDLGGDSVDMIEMLMDFQKRFGVEIPDADFQRLGRFGYTVAYLAGKLGL